MIVIANTWRELVVTLRTLELESTKGFLKRKKSQWVWTQVQEQLKEKAIDSMVEEYEHVQRLEGSY